MVSAADEVRIGDAEPRLMVPLDDLVPFPGNPASRHDPSAPEIVELAASIAQMGVLQPAVAVAASAYAERYPAESEQVASGAFVVLAGVQRLTASRLAGLDEMPVVVRPELLEWASSIALHENYFRKEMTPLEEARALRRVMDEQGLSQRALAKHVARSQAQISKRLALLGLPAAAQVALEEGRLLLRDATVLLERLALVEKADRVAVETEVDERVASAGELSEWALIGLVQEARDAVGQRAAAARAKELAAAEGLRLVNPGKDLGGSWPDHRLDEAEQIEAARERGDLVVAVSGEDVTYYRVSEPPRVAERRADREQQRDDQAEARKARKAREAALGRIVGTRPKQAELVDALVGMVLSGESLGAERTHLARTLAQTAGVGPDVDEDWPWKDAAFDDPARVHLAWIAAVAAREARAARPHAVWDVRDREYLRWLADRGYAPSGWERARLEKIPDDVPAADVDDDDDESMVADDEASPAAAGVIPVESPDPHGAADEVWRS